MIDAKHLAAFTAISGEPDSHKTSKRSTTAGQHSRARNTATDIVSLGLSFIMASKPFTVFDVNDTN